MCVCVCFSSREAIDFQRNLGLVRGAVDRVVNHAQLLGVGRGSMAGGGPAV